MCISNSNNKNVPVCTGYLPVMKALLVGVQLGKT